MSVQAVIVMVGALGLMVSTVVLVRRRITVDPLWPWVATVSILGLVGAPVLGVIARHVRHLGFTATGFSLGILIAFLGLICLQLSISLSGLHRAIQDLSEYAALIEQRMAELATLSSDSSRPRVRERWARADDITGTSAPRRSGAQRGAQRGSVVNAGRGLGYDVCVVDDGSRDRTAQIAAGAGARVLRLPVNLGVGGALRCGFRWALDHGYDVVVQVDADGQHDPRQVNVLLDALRDSGADMIVGSRFAARDGHYRVSLARQIAMKILSARVRRVAGVHVIDSQLRLSRDTPPTARSICSGLSG